MIQILILVAAFGLGAYVGWDYRDGKVAQDIAKAQAAAIEAHNEDAAIDMQAAREAGERDALAKTRFAGIRGQAHEITVAKPTAVVCNLDTERVRVLALAVEAANNNTDSTKRLSTAIGKAASPSK